MTVQMGAPRYDKIRLENWKETIQCNVLEMTCG